MDLQGCAYECSSNPFVSTEMTIKGTTNTVIIISSKVHETISASPMKSRLFNSPILISLFQVTNSSVSLESLHLNLLHNPSPQTSPPLSELPQNAVIPNIRCAVVESSALLVLGCTITLSSSVAPFLLSTAAEYPGISPSLTLINTSLHSKTVVVPPFSEISASQPIIEHATVAISSLSISSVTLSESSGIACHISTDTPLLTLSASITSCSFHNMSSMPTSFPTRRGTCLHQLMAGNDLKRVDNALYGTVTAVLGHSHIFDCLNTTILECENPTRSTRTHSNAETQIKQDVVQDFTSNTGRYITVAGITHYHFISCNFSTSTQTEYFQVINIGELKGTLKLFDCRFILNASSAHVMPLVVAGVKETPHSLLIDSCLFQYDKASTLPSTSNQIEIHNSVMTTIVSSTFTSKLLNSSARLFAFYDSQTFLQFSNSRFEHQFTPGDGSLLARVRTVDAVRLFDCHFENNTAKASGGLFSTEYSQFTAYRCVFKDSTSGGRGGVLYAYIPISFYLEECQFVNNKALEYDSANSSYTHFRGNDINIFANSLALITSETVVACSSTSPAPKIAFYRTIVLNGPHQDDTLLLPDPVAVSVTKLFVEVGGSGTECTEQTPCSQFATALAKAGTLTEVLFGGGEHVESGSAITKSVRLIGKGWMTNTTLATILTTSGMKVGVAGNVTLASLSLKPSSASTTLLSQSASNANSWISNVWIEGITDHTVPLFSFSYGTARFAICTINSITLTQHAVLHLLSAASLTLREVWFMHVTSQALTASCIHSTTLGLVDLRSSDYAHCSSKGPAGCLHILHSYQSKLILSDMLFRANTASPSISPNASDMYLSYHPNALSGSLRSMSEQPHAIVADKTYTFQFPDAGYHDHGIIHPNNMRFYWGIPLSQAGTVQDVVDRLLPNSRVDIRMVVMNETLTPVFVEEKEIGIHNARFNINLTLTTPSVTVSTNGYVRFDTGYFYLTQGYQTTPFVVQASTASMVIINTYMVMPATIYHPIVKSVGSLHLEGAYMEAQLAMDGCSVIETTGGSFRSLVHRFNNLSSTVDGSYLNAKNTDVTIYQNTFRNCSARNGGALFIELSGSNSIQMYHQIYVDMFVGCSASEKGGVLYVKGTSSHSRPIQLNRNANDHSRFEGNTAVEGTDIYVEASLFEGKTLAQIPTFGGVSRSSEFRVVIEGRDDAEEKELIHFFLQTPTISVNGSVYEGVSGYSGKDDDNCKWTGTHCATLQYGMPNLKQKYKNDTHFPQTIRFVWNMTYTEKDVLVSDQDVTVIGTTTSNAAKATVYRSIVDVNTSMTEGAFLFTIDKKATFTVKNLDIRPITKCGLFDLKDDANSLQLDDVAIICAVGDAFEVPLIKSTAKPTTIVGCQFHTSKDSSDSAMFSQPFVSFSSTTSSVSILSTTFESFSISSTPLIAIDTTQPITFITNTFTDITRTPTAPLVRVTSSSLKSVVLPSLWTGSFTPTQPLLDFVGRDSSLDSNHRFFESSLLFYLLRPTGSIVAGETASHEESEHAECGTDRLRCSSLNSALSSAVAHSIDTPISVAGTTLLSAPLDVTAAASFSSTTGTQTIQQSATGSIMMNADAQKLSFSSLVFDLSPSSTFSTLFTVTAGSLALISCSVGIDTPTELNVTCSGLIHVASAATLTLTASTIRNLKFTHPTLGTAIRLQSGSSFSSDVGSIFSSVSSNATGSLIFVHSADLDTTSKTSPFNMLKSTIQLPIDTLFTDEEKKLFVGQVGSQSTESLLYFWFPFTAAETTLSVDENGEDHPNCGISQLPCKALETGFASLKTTGTTLVLNKADTITTTLTAKFAAQKIQSKTTEQPVSVTSSGALSVPSTLKLTLHTLAFSFESGTRTSPFVKVTTGSLIVEQCSFGSTMSDTTLSSAVFDVKGSLAVKSVNFTRLDTSQPAGLFKLEHVDADTLSFVTTRIEGCASSVAPLLSLSLSSTSQQTNWDFDLSGLSFLHATSNAAPSGALIFISGSFFETQIVPSRFPSIDPETDENKFWGFDSSTNVESSLLVYLVQPGSWIDVDGTNGKDIAHCGHFGVSCLTIEKGIGRATAADSMKQINIKNTTPLSTSISPTSLALTIAGETMKKQIPIESDLHFTVQSDALYLSLLAFTTTVGSFSNSLITLTSTGSLFVTSCSFSGFSSTSAASILTATIATSKSVQFSDTTFTTCNSTGTVRSGVLDVSMVEGSDFSVIHSSNPFVTCSSSDCSADCIVISHPTLSKMVVNDILKFGWDQSSPSYHDFVGKEGSHTIPVPLSLYFLALPTSTFISADSNDVTVCGFVEYPCASLTALHNRIKDTVDTTITFNTNVEHSTELAFSNSVTISGNEKTMTIKETSATATNTPLFSLTANTVITSLFITVQSNFKHASVFHSLSDSLTIENCSFTQSGAGSIVGSLIQIKSGASLTLHATFFVSISSTSEKAGVIVADISESASFLLNNNTFASCSCAGQAHSIFLDLENTTEVTSSSFDYEMKDLVFSSTSSNAESTLSIDVLVVGHHLDRTVTLDRWEGSFRREKGESVWGDDKTTGMNTSLLPYLVDLEGEVEVDDNGFTFEKCGHFHLFCSSFELGVARMEEANLNRIKIMEKIAVSSTIRMKGENSVVGASMDSILCFTQDGQFENSAKDYLDSSLSFSSIVITVQQLDRTTPLFVSTCGSVSFTSCSFLGSSSTSISFSLISISQSDLILSEVITNSVKLTSAPLIVFRDGEFVVVHSTFSSINVTPSGTQDSPFTLRAVDQPSSFSIGSLAAQTTFTDLKGAKMGGALGISIGNADSSVSIVNTLFENCQATTAGGAALISFLVKVDSSELIVSASFSKCSLTSANGNGQWMLLVAPTITDFVTEDQWKETLAEMNRREHMKMIWCEAPSLDAPMESMSLLDILRPGTSAEEIFVHNGSSFTGSGCGQTRETACQTIDLAVLEMKTEGSEIVIEGEGRLGDCVGVFGGYFGLRGESSLKTQLKVNGKGFGGTDGMIGGMESAELSISNLRLTELASSDGLSDYLVFLSDSSLSMWRCCVEASESVGLVHGTRRSSVEIVEVTMRRTAFSSNVFLLVDESSVSLSDSTWTDLHTSTGSLVEVRGWPKMKIEISNTSISNCVCADTNKGLLEIGLSGSLEQDNVLILIKGSTFEATALSSPIMHISGSGLRLEVIVISSTMKWKGSTSRAGMMIEWAERQPSIVRRGLKMENCCLVVKKL
ncbi:hypothetical protein BLNAU_7189 [Blattamonas nauphoetae]|uniref:Uncharacterized protein n=1 Tax=Blattamonas nauphoetae TaxID=2049346 RepID=A0ABQ9Y203_9EUKA|nr:hypothetical protein BLNAU_7189 [Blattamonas nauphoetae]